MVGDDSALNALSQYEFDSDDTFRGLIKYAIKKIKSNKT